MKFPAIILALWTLVSCGDNEPRQVYLNGLTSCNKDSICISSFYFGEQKDKSVVTKLLTGINDIRVSHHIRHKGMSIYYCKMAALRKISGLDIKLDPTDKPNIEKIEKVLDWALKNKLLASKDEIDLTTCALTPPPDK